MEPTWSRSRSTGRSSADRSIHLDRKQPPSILNYDAHEPVAAVLRHHQSGLRAGSAEGGYYRRVPETGRRNSGWCPIVTYGRQHKCDGATHLWAGSRKFLHEEHGFFHLAGITVSYTNLAPCARLKVVWSRRPFCVCGAIHVSARKFKVSACWWCASDLVSAGVWLSGIW